MGFGGISPFQLIIILLIVLLLFGGKRLRGLGSDLGSAIKGFKKSMDDSDNKSLDQKNMNKEAHDTNANTNGAKKNQAQHSNQDDH